MSISKLRPSDRRDCRVVWGLFAGLQLLCAFIAVEAVGTEAGLTLALLETGLTGGGLTLWLREAVRPATEPRTPEGGRARAGTGRNGRVWLFLTLATLVGFPAGVALALALGGALGWQGADRLLGVMLLAPAIWSGLCFAVLWRVLPGRPRQVSSHV